MPPRAKSFYKPNWLIATAIGATTLILLLATESRIGVTWDEPDYIVAAESYVVWFGALFHDPGEALGREAIDRYWTA